MNVRPQWGSSGQHPANRNLRPPASCKIDAVVAQLTANGNADLLPHCEAGDMELGVTRCAA